MRRDTRRVAVLGALALSLVTSPELTTQLARAQDGAAQAGPELAEPMLELQRELVELGASPEVANERVREAARRGWLGPIELPPEVTEPDPSATPVSLPVGGPRSAATPQALPMPDGEGSIQGMGESFSPSLSSGTLSFSVPIALPAGRAGVAPSLALGYSSGAGSGAAGYGWGLGVAAIARQTDRGLPRYADGPVWHPAEDRFVYAGSHELVPVSSAAMSALDGGQVPAELAGWQEYRSQVEGSFLRAFRSPDSTRWIVQSPDGTRHELGLLSPGEGPSEVAAGSAHALVTDGARVASWALTRTSDVHGSTIYYTYSTHEGEQYLTDIHYVSPASCAGGGPSAAARRRCAAPLAQYGAHVRVVYEDRPDPAISYRTGWRIRTAKRLRRIEVTAAGEAAGARYLVRRYHFAYDPRSYHSLLTSIAVEGRPETAHPFGVLVGDSTVAESSLGDALVGPTLPPMRFRYSGEDARARGLDGFPALDRTRRRGASSPAHGVGDARADLYDVNADGLVDVLVTDPARFRAPDGSGAVGVYFNGFTGAQAVPASAGSFSEPVVVPVPATYAHAMQLNNPNIVPMDVDGDGRSDLLHMPRVSRYGFFTPVRNASPQVSPASQGWRFAYLDVEAQSDPGIDLSREAERTRALDVNGDGLVDVVRTAGTAIQSYLNLGWYPGGEGRFGSASLVDGQWVLSIAPVESCLPWAGAPVSFADPEVRLADMNGDGLEDIVRLSPGAVRWWPGLGHGRFGEACGPGITGAPPITMEAPRDIAAELDTTHLADVDGDGASDLVRVGDDTLEVWFNRGGLSFTRRAWADGLPWSRDLDSAVRFADVDGSGTLDVLYARARSYEWVDPMGGQRRRLLTEVDNGLGALTVVTYGTSAQDYLRDLAAPSCVGPGCERFTWQGRDDGQCDARVLEATGECAVRSTGSPAISTVVRSTTTTDRLDVLGAPVQLTRDEYAYHDGYYEGIEQEARGFGATDVRAVGGTAQGTSVTRTWMHQGRRPRSIAADRLAINPWESLKGRTYLLETWEESTRRVLVQAHTALRVRRLITGLDGREVTWAFPERTDTVRYDHSVAWAAAAAGAVVAFPGVGAELPGVARDLVGAAGAVEGDAVFPGWTDTIPLRSTVRSHALVASTIDEVDHAGHVLRQTAWGRVKGEWGEPLPAEEIVSHTVPVLLDPQEWVWRTSEAWTSGHGSTERLGWTVNVYPPGQFSPSRTMSHVTLPRAYEFAGDSDGSEGFVQSAQDVVASLEYDAWGNVVASCAGADVSEDETQCLRLSRVTYDEAYRQVVTGESIATDFGGGMLESSGQFDRVAGTYAGVVDPRGAATRLGHDGFGRVTYVLSEDVRGCAGAGRPTTRVRYQLTTDPSARPLSIVETTTELDCHDPSDVLVARSYVDGLGRARATLASDGPGRWVRSGLTQLTPRGQPHRSWGSAYVSGAEPALSAVVAPGAEASSYTLYDAFGRVAQRLPLGATSGWYFTYYGATFIVECDPNDLTGGHVAVQTCMHVRRDGHDRPIDTIEINRQGPGMPMENLRLWPTYRADGVLVALERAQTASRSALPYARNDVVGGRRVVRTFAVDSIGRRIASTDRDTDARRSGTTEANRSWRYLYSRVGDLVAVRDPRGCGQNYYYDRAGRLLGEDYVSCGEAEPHGDSGDETVPAGAIAMGVLASPRHVETRTYYDGYPFWAVDELAPPAWSEGTHGLVTASSDRGARSVVAYDMRGLAGWTARQIAMLPDAPPAQGSLSAALPDVTPSPAPASGPRVYDELHTYVSETFFDHAGRGRSSLLPRDPDYEGAGPAPLVGGRVAFDARGLPGSVWLSIDGVERAILAAATYDAYGAMRAAIWGDDAGGARVRTRTFTDLDARRRPSRVEVVRDATCPPSSERPLCAVTSAMHQSYEWDLADNLLAISDLRIGSEWPEGFRPQSVRMTHDALYRVIGADYEYSQDAGPPVALDAAVDYRAELARLRDADPMRGRAAPSVAGPLADRVVSLTWSYDFLGNTTEWTDDQAAFHERSLDRITNGFDEASGRPSAIRLATSISTGTHAFDPAVVRGGWLEVDYGDSGNVAAVTVHGQCVDAGGASLCADPGGTVGARRGALRAGCACSVEQHYQYRLDELNQITDARRYDRAGSGDWTLAAHLRYGYDAGNQRVIKEVRDAGTGPSRFAIWPYAGDYERRGLLRGLDGYEATAGTETSYLVGGARIVWRAGSPALGLDPDHRITLPLPDLLGTSSAVIDLVTGELVESSTYYPNGARETVRSSELAEVPLEPAGFTGKEADEEVGLTYFGMRFLMPRLGRWATPDPLQIHAEGGGEVMNNYHYVSGNLLQARDPIGMDSRVLGRQMEAEGVVRGKYTQAQHIFPEAIYRLPGIGEWLEARGFHVDSPANGVFLPDGPRSPANGAFHLGNHDNYSAAMYRRIRDVYEREHFGRISSRQADTELSRLQDRGRAASLAADGIGMRELSVDEWGGRIDRATPMDLSTYRAQSRGFAAARIGRARAFVSALVPSRIRAPIARHGGRALRVLAAVSDVTLALDAAECYQTGGNQCSLPGMEHNTIRRGEYPMLTDEDLQELREGIRALPFLQRVPYQFLRFERPGDDFLYYLYNGEPMFTGGRFDESGFLRLYIPPA